MLEMPQDKPPSQTSLFIGRVVIILLLTFSGWVFWLIYSDIWR